jgi:hypothetical protein
MESFFSCRYILQLEPMQDTIFGRRVMETNHWDLQLTPYGVCWGKINKEGHFLEWFFYITYRAPPDCNTE